ncbi:MAG: polyprenyl diphosphate synthase [Candidatus Thermoplasmatota archaeon]|nr:polyprenyl diphosphate synthase [Candidatus Thermoplasmatota archaeon]MEC7415897.1 polyprenyl diphosphate synthase [Candidatus Thermoplasmatota archaeon]MEC7977061.1 polyprenyl diphosphate synthase [Candidatus Thermoplasmatota archaeon]MEC8446185.1 polyprenyl diphosphate synthase [Candidatus Thermoplasmatota archaeon]MEC9138089.1 polyprenyl diphosphate synthase [Candidatus Thermoplasmatota archaeon]
MFKLARKAVSPIYAIYQRRLESKIKNGEVPNHLAVIMDGNRRYAESVGLLPHEGHLKGKNTLENLSDWCRSVGIKILTVYAFSLENFNRSEDELEKLMDLFAESFRNAGDDSRVHKNKVRVRALGHRELLPDRVKEAIDYAESKTKNYTNFNYNLAVAYGGRQEIVRSMKILGKLIEKNQLKADDIDADLISSNLYTSDLPDPDLILRTSGEERISNFLLWQLAYSELYFADVFWPDMRKIDFLRAIRSFQQRNRRLGK